MDARIEGRGDVETYAVLECQACGTLWGDSRDFAGIDPHDESDEILTDGGVVTERAELDPVETSPERLEGCWLRRERNGTVLIGEIDTVRTMNGERWINFLVATRDDGKRGVTAFPERDRETVTVVENRTAFEQEAIGRGP